MVQGKVWVGDCRLPHVFIYRRFAALVTRLHLDLGALAVVPLDLLFADDLWFVVGGVDLDFLIMRWPFRPGARNNPRGLARRQLSVHARRRNTDTLLPARHAQTVEPRSIE
jgi:hypothetical protein